MDLPSHHRLGNAAGRSSPLLAALVTLAISVFPAMKLGSEFMPTLNEGSLLFMPITLPALSVTKSAELLQTQDKIIKTFPEVESVFGKAGRANTATDPAPLEMAETVINLKPESEWRAGMTIDKLIAELDQALQIPGVSNAWTMPIKNRIDMLATGIRTPIGIKVFGKDLGEMEELARQIEAVVKTVPGTTSAYAERTTGGYYLDIEPDRIELARYGLAVGDLLEVISVALGSETADDHGRGPRTLRCYCALSTRAAAGSVGHRQPGPDTGHERRHDSLGTAGERQNDQGATQHSHRKRAAVSIHIRRYSQPRHWRLRGRGAKGGARAGEISARILRDLERPVRIYGAGQAEAESSRAAYPGDHFPASLPQFPAIHRNPHRHAVGAFFTGGRRLADMAAWLQSQRRGSCGIHRARRRCRGDGRRDADLSRPCLGRTSRKNVQPQAASRRWPTYMQQ